MNERPSQGPDDGHPRQWITAVVTGELQAFDMVAMMQADAWSRGRAEARQRDGYGVLGSRCQLPAGLAGIPEARNSQARAYLWAIYDARDGIRSKARTSERVTLTRAFRTVVRALPDDARKGSAEAQAGTMNKLARRYGWLSSEQDGDPSTGLLGMLENVERICKPYDR